MEYVGQILVEDASGARFYIYEYKERRLFRRLRRLVLETGEPVNQLDVDTYIVAATGETLLRPV